MADKLSYADNVSTPASEFFLNSILTELIALTATSNVDSVLRKALSMVVRLTDAEAGSILFQAHSLLRARSGPFRPEAINRIEHWEGAIGKRLTKTTWRIPENISVPVSIAELADNHLMLANIPLVRDTTVVGALSLVLPPGRNLTEEQRDLLPQLGRAIGQITALITDLDLAGQSVRQIEVFYQVGQALATTFDIDKLLSDTINVAVNVIDAGAASIMLIDQDKQELVFEVSHGARAQMLRQQRIPIDEGIAGWVANHGEPVIANDARTDPRFSHRVDVRTGFLTQSIAAVPLKTKGRVVGVLEVLNKYSGDGFTQEDIRLMDAVAAQAGIALENARLYQQVRQERDSIVRAQEEVRRELVRKLHDGPVQLLSAISMSLDHLERLNEVKPEAVHNEIIALRNLVHQATRDARNLLFEMRPVILETQGLTAAFEQYAIQLQSAEEFSFHFKPLPKPVSIDSQVAGIVFSIVQEAINNIRRHAAARNVWLALGLKENHLLISVRDDGRGFDVKQNLNSSDQTGHFGLLNMRERAELIEADLRFESRTEAPDRGTTVYLSVPLPTQP